MKERAVWQEAGIEPQERWYISSGAGMAEVLRMANEMEACTLADRGTFLAQRERFNLVILSEGDPLLRNPYAVIVVSPETHPGVNHKAGMRFSEFLLSPNVQQVIGDFGVERFGQPLFFPRPDG